MPIRQDDNKPNRINQHRREAFFSLNSSDDSNNLEEFNQTIEQIYFLEKIPY